MELDLGLLRRRRVRMVRQTEVAECGLASLAMIAAYHGYDTDLDNLRRRFELSQRGVTLKSLIAIADQLGLASRAVKLPLEQLGDLRMPAILHWNMTHFVVLEEVRRNKALVHNPEGRSAWIPFAEVSRHFTGIALELEPTAAFESAHDRKTLKLSQLWTRITGLKRALLQTLVLSMVMQAFVLASPYYMQVALDSALPALDVDLLTVLALGFGLFTLFNAVAGLLRGFVLLSAGTALGYGISSSVARRLFRLPVSWFERRHVGDVLSRFQSIAPIRTFLTEGAVAATLDGSLAVLTLVVMIFYSPTLTAIALVAFALYALVRAISFMAQREAQEEAIVMSGREQSTIIESVRGMITLRLFNREAVRHGIWLSRLTDSMNASVSLSRIGLWQSTANTLIFGIDTILSIWLAVRMMIAGGFSAGMVFAYLAYKTQFQQKAASFIDQAIVFRMLGLHLERLADIALAEEDRSFAQPHARASRMKGRLELRNLAYRYSSSDPLVLKGVDLAIEPGEHVAITGPSGGGKSTLVKIMLGLIEPTEGDVLVDDVPIEQFGLKHFHDQVGAILQDDHLFAGSLAENIALFEEAPDMERVMLAAKAAAIDTEIDAMPMAYETLVGDMGSTLSGGQKQRLLLARALYRQPRLLIMDEATSHLDAEREREVIAAIKNLGITRVVIAHRRETIAAADRILAAEDGRLVDVTDRYVSGAHRGSARAGGAA